METIKMKKNILWFLTLFLIPFVSAATTNNPLKDFFNGVGKAFSDGVRIGGQNSEIKILFVFGALILLTVLFYVGTIRVFKDNRVVSIIISILFAAGIVFGTSFAYWLKDLFEVSAVLLYILFVLCFIVGIYFGFVKVPHKFGLKAHSEAMEQTKDWAQDRSDYNREMAVYRKERQIYVNEVNQFESILGRMKGLPDPSDASYGPQKDSIKGEIDTAQNMVQKTINYDKNLITNTKRPNNLNKLLLKISNRMKNECDDAKTNLDKPNPKRAINNIQRVIKLLKKERKGLKDLSRTP
nr:hypothetical protein [Nanoarchaeum sp.]